MHNHSNLPCSMASAARVMIATKNADEADKGITDSAELETASRPNTARSHCECVPNAVQSQCCDASCRW
eukprot:6283-Heterococcus_DN1.PRE.3